MADPLLEEVQRRLQDQASLLQQIQSEVQHHIKDMSPLVQNFYLFVMHPETGLVVKMRHLEANVKVIDQHVATAMAAAQTLAKVEIRVAELEEKDAARVQAENKVAEDKRETRRYLVRDVIIGTVVLVASTVGAALLTAKMLGH